MLSEILRSERESRPGRGERHLSRDAVAKAIGEPEGQVTRWETGTDPRPGALLKLLVYYGLEPAELLMQLAEDVPAMAPLPRELSQDEIDPDLAAAISQANDPEQAVAIAQEIEERLKSLDEAEAPRPARRRAR